MHIAKWLPLVLLLLASTAQAQSTTASDLASPTAPAEVEQEDVPAPPEATTAAPAQALSARTERPVSGTSYAEDVNAAVALRLELESINSQQNTANALYVTSAILAVLGTGALAAGMVDLISSIGRSSGSNVGGYLVLAGAVLNVGHVVTMVIAACFDYGSGSHRRKLLRDHPELALELSPGPGDAGIGLTLRF